MSSANETIVIDTSDEVLTATPPFMPTIPSKKPCMGYRMTFPDGSSPYKAYPHALHAGMPLPWDYWMSNGVMTLYARTCTRFQPTSHKSCSPCRDLAQNKSLAGIIRRGRDGVHENSQIMYHGFDSIEEVWRRKNRQIEFYRLRGLNQARKLLGTTGALSDHKRFTVAVASGKVQRIDRVIAVGLSQKKGIRGLLSMLDAAAQGLYRPKSYTEEEVMRARLVWMLGGNRIGNINHLARGDPSLTYMCGYDDSEPLVPSPACPTIAQVSHNVDAAFGSVLDVIQKRVTALHVVVMFDELATEKRIRWDNKTNHFLGVCRQHGPKTSLEFVNEGDMEELFRCLDEGEIHYAAEATIAALGVLCNDHRIYPARAILASGDCKRESGAEHSKVVQTVLDGVNARKESTRFRITSIASDGETRRGTAFIQLTFKAPLLFSSPIHHLLAPLVFMNLHVGDDDLTCDKDWKHVIKRLRNLLLRARGVVIHGFRITPDVIKDHLKSEGHSADHIRSLFNPNDQQDVKAAFDMLKDIWTLPKVANNPKPGFQAAREALWILGKLLYHIVFPYLCVDLSLSEQLEHLSAAAHLALDLYHKGKQTFIPTGLFIDLMLMIKNVYFCVAKAKVDDPDGCFWIILLGTDRLEELFGILRTMVGNDANLDNLQLVSRISRTTAISNILAKYPQWDRSPRRLKIPAITRESKELPHSSDHIKPGSWRGNVALKDVSILTAWRRGRLITETDCPFTSESLAILESTAGVDILSPFGKLLFETPLDVDDIDESLDDLADSLPINPPQDEADIDNRLEVEDAIAEMAIEDQPSHSGQSKIASSPPQFPSTLLINGKLTAKSRILARFSKYRKAVSSTDHLRRVQEVERYVSAYSTSSKAHEIQRTASTDDAVLVVSDPIVSLICCDGFAWLSLGEVNALKIDGESVDFIPHDMLSEGTVSISYQLLGLRPATMEDDKSGKHDWRSCRTDFEHSFTVPGSIVQPVNPTLSDVATLISFYLFDSRVLVALTSSLFESLTAIQLKNIPKLAPTQYFPYREASGKACFVCEDISISDSNITHCQLCAKNGVSLDISQPQRVLEHIGAHILHDTHVDRTSEPCGLCLQPSSVCRYFVKKGKGARASMKVDRSSGCLLKCNFSYGVASQSSATSPCSNVPLVCPVCPKDAPAVWRYNLYDHFKNSHEPSAIKKHEDLYTLSEFEVYEMKQIWRNRAKVSVKRPRKSNLPPLVISEPHQASIRPNDDDTRPTDNPTDELQETSGGIRENSESEQDQIGESEEIAGGANFGAHFGLGNSLPATHLDSVTPPMEFAKSPSHLRGVPQSLEPFSEGPSRSIVEPSARTSRKRTAIALSYLADCTCGSQADQTQAGVIECRRAGCETRWYHSWCVGESQTARNYVCEACLSTREGKQARR